MSAGRVLVLLGVYNVVQNTLLLSDRSYVGGNVIVTGVLVGEARRDGLGAKDLGLDRPDLGRGLAVGTSIACIAASSATLLVSRRLVRPLLADDRLRDMSRREIRHKVLLRFPLGTALFEEVAFRGLLPALLRRRHPAWRAELLSAGAFAAWHLIPTAKAIAASPSGRSLSLGSRSAIVVGGSAAAGVGGLGLSFLRNAGGSLVTPWLAHLSVNAATFLVVARRERPQSP